MLISEIYKIIKKESVEYANSFLVSESLHHKYAPLLHALRADRYRAWNTICVIQDKIEQKFDDYVSTIASYNNEIEEIVDVVSGELENKRLANISSIKKKFEINIIQDLFQYLSLRSSSFVEKISVIIADKENLDLMESTIFHDEKTAMLTILFEIKQDIEKIVEKVGNTKVNQSLIDVADKIDPTQWLHRLEKDVYSYMSEHTKTRNMESLYDNILIYVKDIVSEILLNSGVFLLLESCSNNKINARDVVLEIILVSLLSPSYFRLWYNLMTKLGMQSSIKKIGQSILYINK